MSIDIVPALEPYTVTLLLQYIAPPSQLTEPLPPHLISQSLAQRHHFLSISPENALEYIAWSGIHTHDADGFSVVDALEELPTPIEDHPPVLTSVRYTADDEHLYGHATVVAKKHSVRLLFQWDPTAKAWKYHDARTTPLASTDRPFDSPTDALRVAQAALAQPSQLDYLAEASDYSRGHPEYGYQDDDDDGAGDYDYWNSYGGGGDVDDEPGRPSLRSRRHSSKSLNAKGEDAYWAQYGSVHGTADSTIPSPAPEKARKPFWAARGNSGAASHAHSSRAPSRGEPLHAHFLEDGVLLAESGFARKAAPVQTGLVMGRARDGSPPSAEVLRELLAAVPQRRMSTTEDHTNEGPAVAQGSSEVSKHEHANGLTNGHTLSSTTSAAQAPPSASVAADAGLQQALAGIYAAWKSTRAGVEMKSSKDSFLQFVEKAIET